jgi:hypothetical protein
MMQWWWCSGDDAVMLMQWCWCSHEDAVMRVQGWWCSDVDVTVRSSQYSHHSAIITVRSTYRPTHRPTQLCQSTYTPLRIMSDRTVSCELQLAISWSRSIIFSVTWCFPRSENNKEHFLIFFSNFRLRNICGELRRTTFDLCYAHQISSN